ncbi:MAG: hypothetical protein WA875_05865, partial [Candidatus Acidiferrales bacterium]
MNPHTPSSYTPGREYCRGAARGNRTEKGGTGVTTKWYWYGLGSQALDESDGSGNVTDEYIYFGSQRVAHLTVSSGLTDFYVADHLGTSRALLQ